MPGQKPLMMSKQAPSANQCTLGTPLCQTPFDFNAHGEGLDLKTFLDLYDVHNDSPVHNMREMTGYPVHKGETGSNSEVLDLNLMETSSVQTSPVQKVPEAVSPISAHAQSHEQSFEPEQCADPFCPHCLAMAAIVSSPSVEKQTEPFRHPNSVSSNSDASEVLGSNFTMEVPSETPSPQVRMKRDEEFDDHDSGVATAFPSPEPSHPFMWNPSMSSFHQQMMPSGPGDPNEIQDLLNDFLAIPAAENGGGGLPVASQDRKMSFFSGLAPHDSINFSADPPFSSLSPVLSSAEHPSHPSGGEGSEFDSKVKRKDSSPIMSPPNYEPSPGLPPVRDKIDDSIDLDRPIQLGSGIEVTENQVVQMPVHELNRLLYQSKLTEAEISLVKETRRRGKNKVAARNCRKRKLDTIADLEKEVDDLKLKKAKIAEEKANVERELEMYKQKTEALTRFILGRVKDGSGHSLNSEEFSLEKSEDGRLFVLRKLSTADGKTVAVVA